MNKRNSKYGDLYPLSNPQKRIWYSERVNTGLPISNIGGAATFDGNVDYEVLEKAVNIYLEHNEVLRIRLHEEDGEAYQYVQKYEYEQIPFFDFSDEADPETAFREWADQKLSEVFELYHNKLYYIAIFKITGSKGGYFGNLFHAVCDGWSINMFTKEIAQIYSKLLNHETIPEIKHTYMDYLELEERYLNSEKFLKNKEFWMDQFKTLPEIIKTKRYLPKPGDSVYKGGRNVHELSIELSSAIRDFAKKYQVTINTIFVSAFLIYLYKYYGKTDLVVGNPTFNRSGKKEKEIFGMLTSTMAFRYQIKEEDSVSDMAREAGRALMKCFFNQKYPYNYLTQDLELQKRGYYTLMDFFVNYYNTKNDGDLTDMPIEKYEGYNGYQLYKFGMIIKDWSEGKHFTLCFDYRLIDFNSDDIENIYHCLLYVFKQMLDDPDKKLKDFSILTEAEENKIRSQFTDTKADYPKEKTIDQLFEEQVLKTPDKTAIRFKTEAFTYKQLNEKANELAHSLVERGLKRQETVGILAAHSIEAVVGMLAVIKAGGTYLPIDPEYPVERIDYILEDSKAKFMLMNIEMPQDLNYSGAVFDLNSKELYGGRTENLNIKNAPEDLVYMIYTSGSTGRPKGVMIKHVGLVNYASWAKKVYVKGTDEVFALYSSFAFDLTVTSIFTPLISGSTIEVYRDDEDEYVLYRIMREKKATIVKCTPAHLALIKELDNSDSSVRRFIVGGENLRTDVARSVHESFGGKIEIYNEYGPTETVVGCMIYQFNYELDGETSVAIGVPADNVQIYILDEEMKQVPINTAGEMYIAGDGVGLGYLNKKEMTEKHFIENPFDQQTKMYRSGDLAKIKYDGNMEYLGRADQQVKVRGYRIELGEIEKGITHFDEVKEAVVVKKEDENGNAYLCGYYVESNPISESRIYAYLKECLPEYMVPSFLIKLDRIPLTHNGKVDSALLPEPEKNRAEVKIAPGTEMEKELKETLEELLHMEQLSMGDNFLNLGGDSIKAIQLSSKLRDKGFLLKVKQILANPVLKDMAAVMTKDDAEEDADLTEEDVTVPKTPVISWLLEQKLANLDYYNQSVMLEMNPELSADCLEHALDELIHYHDALRLNYKADTDELYYNNKHLQEKSKIEVYDLSDYDEMEQTIKIKELSEQVKGSLELENGILIKGAVFCMSKTRKCLLLTAHHIVTDGVSWRILLEDFMTALSQIRENQKVMLPKKSYSYKKWAEQLNQYGAGLFQKEEDYWRKVNEAEFTYPTDFADGEALVSSIKHTVRSLGAEQTNLLTHGAGNSYHIEADDILIISLVKTIKELTGNSKTVLELEGHGREELFEKMDWNRSVGWFTSIYPAALEMKEEQLSKQIIEVKEQLRNIPSGGIGYGILTYIAQAIERKNRNGIRFNYLGDFSDTIYENDLFHVSRLDTGLDSGKDNSVSALIDINAMITDGNLQIELAYSSQRFKETSMELLMDTWISNIGTVMDHCLNEDNITLTSSDFDSVSLSQDELESLFE